MEGFDLFVKSLFCFVFLYLQKRPCDNTVTDEFRFEEELKNDAGKRLYIYKHTVNSNTMCLGVSSNCNDKTISLISSNSNDRRCFFVKRRHWALGIFCIYNYVNIIKKLNSCDKFVYSVFVVLFHFLFICTFFFPLKITFRAALEWIQMSPFIK